MFDEDFEVTKKIVVLKFEETGRNYKQKFVQADNHGKIFETK